MRKSEYRPDIDGLRAVAVMSVLLFHAGFSPFSGGFVGVDVFFVISGYLITKIIKDEVERCGSFSFSNFYVRRIRRLLPALLFTLVASLLLGFFLFSPQHLERLGKSVIAALFSVSNFFFWSESGYFDTASDLKPLLHTWSLSVEEQFYLVWPLLIFLSIKHLGRFSPWAISALGGLSLLGAVKMLGHDASGAYFLTPIRAYEFAIGAVLVWVGQYRLRSNLIMELLLTAGLTMVLVPVFVFDENTAFPGIAALVPCLGTAMAIYAGQARFTGILLRNPVSVKIGLFSYSLYLAHWPIYVFYKYYIFRDLVLVEKLGIVVASLLVGWGMYRLIETPFRKVGGYHVPKRKVFASYAVAAATLAAPSAMISANSGLEWRIPEEIRYVVSNVNKKRLETWKFVEGEGAPGKAPYSDDERHKVMVVGDSHGKDFFNALHLSGYLGSDIEVRFVEMKPGCLYELTSYNPPSRHNAEQRRRCREMGEAFLNDPNLDNSETWIYSARWNKFNSRYIPGFKEWLISNLDADLVVLGRKTEFKDVPELVINFGRLHGAGSVLHENIDHKVFSINEEVERVSEQAGVAYLDKHDIACLEDSCYVVDERDNLLYYDYGHFTLEGAEFFGQRMRDMGFLDEVL